MEPPSLWSGFYKKPLRERQNQLRLMFPNLFRTGADGDAHGNADGSTAGTAAAANGKPDEDTGRAGATRVDPAVDSTPRTGAPGPAASFSSSTVGGRAARGRRWSQDGGGADAVFPVHGLSDAIADNMIENCIGTVGLPVGLALNLVMNGTRYVVPMAVEEPSIVAAVSNAGKTLSGAVGGGFLATHADRNVMIAQLQILDVADPTAASERLVADRDELIRLGNAHCATMVERGGGVQDVQVRVIAPRPPRHGRPDAAPARPPYLVLHVLVDVCEAMGANVVNAVAEGMADTVAEIAQGRIGLRILSNLAVHRTAKSTFRIPVGQLAYKGFSGEQVAQGILDAAAFAHDDPFRAATANKGVMNGVDAVALATGQDWRAIEAAAHAYVAVTQGQYGSMADYWLEDGHLCGALELPMAVGTKGGVLLTNPVYMYTHGLLGFPNASTLAMILVTVGLAQSFGALRALATEGIQRGHMSLHARNIATAAGAPPHAISEVTAYMIANHRINLQAAQTYIRAHALHTSLRNGLSKERSPGAAPSMFYFEEGSHKDGSERVLLNVAFETLGPAPVNLELTASTHSSPLQRALLGDKGHAWLTDIVGSLNSVRVLATGFASKTAPLLRANAPLSRKLKLLAILLNIVTRHLMVAAPEETAGFVRLALASAAVPAPPRSSTSAGPAGPVTVTLPLSGIFEGELLHHIHSESEVVRVGLPLLLALWQVYEIYATEAVGQPALSAHLLGEQRICMRALVSSAADADAVRGPTEFAAFMRLHGKRFPVTLFLLCDSLALDPRALTEQRLATLHAIGERLEWVGIAAHDLVHEERDRRLRAPNAVAAFRASTGNPGAAEFKDAVDALADLPSLLAHRTDGWLDPDQIVASVDAIRLYFGATGSASRPGSVAPASATSPTAPL